MTLAILAPTDSQLAYIKALCEQQGWQHPDAIASKDEASRIIGEMKACTYRPEDYAYPFADYSEDEPF
jgi:hypothetical protein